jgi:hypothetical protein
MRRRWWVGLVGLLVAGPALEARAQGLPLPAGPGPEVPSQISGTVHDDGGRPLGGVMVIALGSTLVSATSDVFGRFTLALPPGEYVLRATREGFVSTYRESVRVPLRALIKRQILLNRPTTENGTADNSVASGPATPRNGLPGAPDHSHGEAAWRLRRLPPTVLRDQGGAPGELAHTSSGVRPRFSLLEWARYESRRAASYLSDTDFSGHVNYLASGAMSGLHGRMSPEGPSRVADLAVGAPAGAAGEWVVRGVMDAGRLSSWAVHGEYRSREDGRRAFSIGASHSLHAGASLAPSVVVGGERRVTGAYLLDRWRLPGLFEVDYGVRVDRYDYLERGLLPGGRVGFRGPILGDTLLVVSAARHLLAPGSDEFLRPSSPAPWLPPQRTFSPLGQSAFAVEQVGRIEVGVEHAFGRNVVSVRRFFEATTDQTAMLFGLDQTDAVEHYYVATPGGYEQHGWVARVEGRIAGLLRGRVAYSIAQAHWRPGPGALLLEPLVSSASREGDERTHDLTALVEGVIPGTSISVVASYRLNSAYGGTRVDPSLAGRFAAQMQCALPWQPVEGSRLEVLFSIRTLYRDLGHPGSAYDELLTISPPLRVVGGMRLRF